MKEYKTSCIDNETGMEMILSECSYNFACDYLMSKGFTTYDKFEPCGNLITLYFSKPASRIFVYDENRGYLLGN